MVFSDLGACCPGCAGGGSCEGPSGFGQLDPGATTAAGPPAAGLNASSYFRLAVAAGVTVWVITKILDGVFKRG